MAEMKTQQQTQSVTDKNNFLYKNNAQSPNNKPEESAENCVVDHTTEEWNKPENIKITYSCPSPRQSQPTASP